ncbi:hypothetical protein G5V57_27020 [Nordella sp. HKS 07]|uniref:hypothetical protein n=1 Tax=Nordella sp. HKS 07 TaxID=2712222 RepID=UPI0013E10053|nr:hypothetical protein [Nordella sp. HKS 07]QIG51056.1 hypothetical protein G5V57_27020 [Nordella sp. HKS 07]
MDKDAFLRCLEEARHRADHEEMLIEAQKRIVATLTAARTDTKEALIVLDAYERSHDLHLAEIEKLLDVLDKLPPSEGKV